MADQRSEQESRESQRQRELKDEVSEKEDRKIRARREVDKSLWFWLGMMGIVGWAVAIPTLIGVACGMWIDSHFVSRFSWTLMLLFVGVVVGCLNAWYWVTKER